MLAHEILAIREQRGLEHIGLQCLPAAWHFHPERIAGGVEAAILKAWADGTTRILVGYADCGTGGALDRVCERLGVERIAGPHCFAFYQGLERAAALEEHDMTSFFVTDFLARQPDAFLYEPLGLDRYPELAADYFGHYERVVYLAQTENAELEASAREIARRLDLGFERRFTGYGDLTTALMAFGGDDEGAAIPSRDERT